MSNTPVADWLNSLPTERTPRPYPHSDATPAERITALSCWPARVYAGDLYDALVAQGIARSVTAARALVKAEREAGALVRVGAGNGSAYRTAERDNAIEAAAAAKDEHLRAVAARALALGLEVTARTAATGYIGSTDFARLRDGQRVVGLDLRDSVERVVEMLEGRTR